MVNCAICGKTLKTISGLVGHVKFKHGVTYEDYKREYFRQNQPVNQKGKKPMIDNEVSVPPKQLGDQMVDNEEKTLPIQPGSLILPLMLMQMNKKQVKGDWNYCPHCGGKLDDQTKLVKDVLEMMKNAKGNS